jgi:hypothetical protein
MKVVLSSWNNLTNEALGVHSIGQLTKVVLSSWNTLKNEVLGVHAIGQ